MLFVYIKMNKVPRKVWKKSNFVLEKSGKPQSEFCTNPVMLTVIHDYDVAH